jgi:transcriptional regulator with XRE-family HTH domain
MPENNVQHRMTIGVLMRLARENARRTHRDCAVFMGLSSARLAKYEEGILEPALVELETLAHFLGIPVHNLLDEDAAGSMTCARTDIDLAEVARVRTLIIGTRLRLARLQREEKLKTTAESIGLTLTRLKNYELGRRPIPITVLETLCAHLGIKIQSLLDIGIGLLGEAQHRNIQNQCFANLPADIREFVTQPDSLQYLRTAMRLRTLPMQELHDTGTALLSLTPSSE